MAAVKYCPLCDRKVEPVKKFNWVFFLLTVWIGIGLIYLLYHLIFGSRKYCPICGTKRLQSTNKAADQALLQH